MKKGAKKEVTAKQPEKPEVKSYARRDTLAEIERSVQKKWSEKKVYEANANPAQPEKYFATFPYPYMNGKLHLGHAYSVTKAEFMSRYQRMLGKNVLFPFGFHCTGMPIKACADKIKREIELFGCPPNFPPKQPEKEKKKSEEGEGEEQEVQYQWVIMQKMGFKDEEIAKFQDAYYWLRYFPPIAKTDLQRFGLGVDFRRSFITTDANPYYDSFIRWQFEVLESRKKVSFGKRHSIFSPLDNQICADHDRASGETVKPKEYTIVKLKLLNAPDAIASACAGKDIFLAAATLRPETMYGQTNCWLKPDGEYGAFEINDKEVFICSQRAARNMAFQDLSKERGIVKCLASFKGQDIIGCKVKAPNSPYPFVYVLPMLTIDMKKTTGVVTSVPSDSPDDFAALNDLKAKPKLREKFNLVDEMVLPFEVVPIINIPGFEGPVAPILCAKLKIQSQNDANKLAEAKDIAYSDGFSQGVMNDKCGQFSGMKIKDVRDKIKHDLINRGEATLYSEPESVVISRSGDVCVVALTDQWFLVYGEDEWKKDVENWLDDNNTLFKTFHPTVRKELKDTVDWLKEWGCSRSYGLGTNLPWDQQFLIESLSDSTIYMAYYTIAHLLHTDLDGQVTNEQIGIKPEQLTHRVWDYVFLGASYPADEPHAPPEATLKKLRDEFEYWYPVDLRVSGKDLIKNHLTMALYNHAAIWPDQKESKWPRGIFANGYIQVEGEKMSKSKGNFLTMEQVCEEYTADATRIALADAGDSLDDANFTIFTANSSILRLFIHVEWVKEMIATRSNLRNGPRDSFQDRVFESKINKALIECKKNYEAMQYREVLKSAWYDFEKARDDYRQEAPNGMHEELVFKWIEANAIMMAPITPHICEYVWTELLQKPQSVVFAQYPDVKDLVVDKTLLLMDNYLHDFLHNLRVKLQKEKQKPSRAYIYVADQFLPWQVQTLELLKKIEQENSGSLGDLKSIAARVKEFKFDTRMVATVMAFVAQKLEDFAKEGIATLSTELPFDEYDLLTQHIQPVNQVLGGIPVDIYKTSTPNIPDPQKRLPLTQPQKPQIAFAK